MHFSISAAKSSTNSASSALTSSPRRAAAINSRHLSRILPVPESGVYEALTGAGGLDTLLIGAAAGLLALEDLCLSLVELLLASFVFTMSPSLSSSFFQVLINVLESAIASSS